MSALYPAHPPAARAKSDCGTAKTPGREPIKQAPHSLKFGAERPQIIHTYTLRSPDPARTSGACHPARQDLHPRVSRGQRARRAAGEVQDHVAGMRQATQKRTPPSATRRRGRIRRSVSPGRTARRAPCVLRRVVGRALRGTCLFPDRDGRLSSPAPCLGPSRCPHTSSGPRSHPPPDKYRYFEPRPGGRCASAAIGADAQIHMPVRRVRLLHCIPHRPLAQFNGHAGCSTSGCACRCVVSRKRAAFGRRGMERGYSCAWGVGIGGLHAEFRKPIDLSCVFYVGYFVWFLQPSSSIWYALLLGS